MYGHPEAVQEQARALAPACFSVTVTEMQRVVRACRLRASLREKVSFSCFGTFHDAGWRGRVSSCSASTTATNSTRVEKTGEGSRCE